MQKLNLFESINEKQFDTLLEKLMLSDTDFAAGIGVSQASISMKRNRGFNLSFAQVLAFYANYYLPDSDFNELISHMKSDGFNIDFK